MVVVVVVVIFILNLLIQTRQFLKILFGICNFHINLMFDEHILK